MTFLRRWWHQPAGYSWMVRYFESHGALSAYRVGVGISCFCYGLAAVTAYLTFVPPRSQLSTLVIFVGATSAFLVGALWLRGPWPSERQSLLFVVYADIGTTLALLSYGSIEVSFPGCVLLATTGVYVQVFHGPRVLVAHLAWSAVTVTTLLALILHSPSEDHGLTWSQLVVFLPVMFSTPVFLQSVLLNLRIDAHGAMFDPLTGLHNRRGLDDELPRFLVDDSPVSVMVIDVDRFKQINDRFGHEGGDRALRLIAHRLRIDDVLVARTGGEEFAVVARMPAEQAASVAEWLRKRLYASHDDSPLTVSIGVASAPGTSGARVTKGESAIRDDSAIRNDSVVRNDSVTTVTHLIRRADVAMYEAKHRGGNQVVVAAVQ
ncbi:GGDEF domain-containing protein [Rhodococcoides yunnanense]|uniref:GGDEF domain-containing protein n=1 Tax=Rhodococcoides yunnanense TaxID=278209 RepID=UPI001FE756B4|nr:GGDEF domain-containing protein [Rhodococcus yunnanensis]